MSDVILALSPKGIYGLKYDSKTKTESFDLLREEPQDAECVQKALGSLYDDVLRLQWVVASKKMLTDVLSRLMAFKHASNGEATLSILINEIAEDFHGKISALSLLVAYQQIKESNTQWYPQYHEIAELFNTLTKNNSCLEKEVVKRLEIQNMAAKDDA